MPFQIELTVSGEVKVADHEVHVVGPGLVIVMSAL